MSGVLPIASARSALLLWLKNETAMRIPGTTVEPSALSRRG
jgi:hypothetical protein